MRSQIILTVTIAFLSVLSASGTGNESYNQTFTFKNVPAGFDLTDYILALENSNFECYRFETQRRTLVFTNGIQLELFSANEVSANTALQSDCFLPDHTQTPQAVLSLGEGNTIIMNVETRHK